MITQLAFSIPVFGTRAASYKVPISFDESNPKCSFCPPGGDGRSPVPELQPLVRPASGGQRPSDDHHQRLGPLGPVAGCQGRRVQVLPERQARPPQDRRQLPVPQPQRRIQPLRHRQYSRFFSLDLVSWRQHPHFFVVLACHLPVLDGFE